MQQLRYTTNAAIRAKEVRVISDQGENLGVMPTSQALKIAQEKDLDLLLIGPNVDPPVAKIVDFNKFLYDERKKQSSAKAKSKKSEIKELRLTPLTGDGDINRFIKRAIEFMDEGNKVKVSVRMRGRQAMFPDVAYGKLKRVEEGLQEIARPEETAKRIGDTISMVFIAK